MSKRHPDNSAELKRQMANLKAKIERRKRVIEEGVDFFFDQSFFCKSDLWFLLTKDSLPLPDQRSNKDKFSK